MSLIIYQIQFILPNFVHNVVIIQHLCYSCVVWGTLGAPMFCVRENMHGKETSRQKAAFCDSAT